MARATWKGFLRISLVHIPVAVFPATESAGSLSFNQLHRPCQTRIQQKRWCPTCQADVANGDIVKGFEFERGRYVVLSDDDFDSVRPESTRVIDLVQFADASALDPMYVDRTYYLAPDGTMARDAYAVMAAAMVDKIGVGKLAIYGREYLVAVRSTYNGTPDRHTLTLHTLHHAAELRSIDTVDELRDLRTPTDPSQTILARQVVEAFERPLDLATYRDAYREQLQEIIDARIAGQEITARPAPAPIVPANLIDSLKRSLEAISREKKTSARARTPKTATKKRGAA
jgi:DNA end-binding protein Ku